MKLEIERKGWLIGLGVILGIGFGLFINGYWLIDKFPAESKQLLFIIVLASLLASAGYTLLFAWIRKHFATLPVLQRSGLIIASFFLGILFFFLAARTHGAHLPVM